jgi:hypothetical protein
VGSPILKHLSLVSLINIFRQKRIYIPTKSRLSKGLKSNRCE